MCFVYCNFSELRRRRPSLLLLLLLALILDIVGVRAKPRMCMKPRNLASDISEVERDTAQEQVSGFCLQ